MMGLLLVFTGLANAQNVVEIGTGTSTTSAGAFNSIWGYTFAETLYPATEIGTAGSITHLAYHLQSTATYHNEVVFYMKNVSTTAFNSASDVVPVTTADIVYQGAFDYPATDGWYTIELDTPFEYDGVSTLMIACDENAPSYSSRQFYYTSVSNSRWSYYSDTENPNPYNLGAFTGNSSATSYRSNIQLTMQTGPATVSIVVTPNPIEMDARPNNCWMRPMTVSITNEGGATNITGIDFDNNYFTPELGELVIPFAIAHNETVDFAVSTGSGNGDMVGILDVDAGDLRTAFLTDIHAYAYEPVCPDVWELARVISNVNDYRDTPTTVTLYNNYVLPPASVEDGIDAVYKVTFDHDVMLNGNVTKPGTAETAENGKLVVYTQAGIDEVGGPDLNNYYTGPSIGSEIPMEMTAFAGGATTTGYLPMYGFYADAYTRSQYVIPATEIAAMAGCPINSLTYYTASTPANWNTTFKVYLTEVNFASMTNFIDPATATTVYTGALSIVDGQMVVTFDTPYQYNGGNLLIGMDCLAPGTYSSCYFQAVAMTGAGLYAYNYSAPTFTSGNAVPYAPTTTFGYMGRNANRAEEVVYSQEFNSTPSDWTLTGDWYVASYGEGGYWTPDASTAPFLMIDSDANGSGVTISGIATSPVINLDGYTSASINLDQQCVTYGDDLCTIEVYDGTQWVEVANYTSSVGDSYSMENTTIDVTAYANANFQVRFHYSDNGGWNYGWAIDNFQVLGEAGTPGPAPVPGDQLITNMTMLPGTYYIAASSTEAAWDVVLNATELPCPDVAYNPTPADDADGITPSAVTLKWKLGQYTTEYRLRFGTTYYCEDILVDWTTDLAESFTVTNLFNNTNYFWRVEERNAGCPEGVAGPVWGFTTTFNAPTNLHSTNTNGNNLYEGETLHLAWNAIVDRTFRSYNIYMDDELIGSTPSNPNPSATTTFDVDGLSYNLDGYVFYVTAVYDEGESGTSNYLFINVSGEGEVDGYVYEQDGTTGIANATVTKTGRDEFNRTRTYTFTTDANGHYHGAMLAGQYSGVASCPGYQDVQYVDNPFEIVYDRVTPDINYIMDEVYTPVAEVIAEYYPDPEDPESPYVKVYWGAGVASLIEDFETGDFSKFEWNIPAQYPFEITTTNPYEGAYCMQSTNYNVASSTSSIDVNVEIPSDGLMSFYKRISCESSWDNAYFYIDGAQVATFTGTSGWGIKEVAITAGVHNFKWAYTKDSSVNSGEDRFFIDYIDFIHPAQPPVPGETYTFDDGTMQGWTTIDADGDGRNFMVASSLMSGVAGHNGSADFVFSQSYDNSYGIVYPDNYLVSPQVQLGGIVQFYACAQDAGYAAEHFGLAVSTTGNTNAADFTTIQEWTMTAKSVSAPAGKSVMGNRSGRDQGEWYEYTVDLSAYSGMGYVAIRHFNCSDQFYLDVDDITIGEAGKSLRNDRSFQFYRVYRTNCYNDGPYIIPDNTIQLVSEVVDTAYIDVSWPDAAPGVYKWGVSCVYAGNRESEITWVEPTVGRQIVEIGDGTGTTYYGPFNSLWGYSFVEQIYTAAEIGMAGTINSISFNMDPAYTAQTNSVEVFMKNVSRSAFASDGSEYEPVTAGDMVYSGMVTFNGGWTTITLDTPFQYDGTSNLMIGMHEFTSGYSTRYFYYTPTTDYTLFSAHSDGSNPDPYNLGSFSGTKYAQMYRTNIQMDITPGGGSQDGLHESEIVWSNCLDKDMFVNPVDVTVLLNSADSPEGVVVTLTNLNEAEREMYPVAPVTLDESGYYVWDTFRRGDYAVSVEMDGYEPIHDTVAIWDETHLRYVMTEILYGVGNIYVSRTGWAMWDGEIPGPVPPHGEGSTFDYNFDGNTLEDWTLIDANNDGYNWMHSSDYTFEDMSNEGHNASYGFAVSESYINGGYGAVTPDNYLVSPQVNFANGSTFSFWVTDGNDIYGAEHFGVAVSTSGNTSAADFTTISEWTLLSKGEKTGERQLIDGIWYQYTVDLSAYAGQTGYIAIRHFNCYDQWVICVDDCVLTAGAKSDDRHLEYYKVLCTSIDGVPIYNHNTVVPMCQLDTNDPYQAPLVEGDHYLCKVACMYSTGMSAWSEPVEWVYEPCDHWGPVDYVDLNTIGAGNHIEWEFTQGFNPYDPVGPVPPTPGDTEFSFSFDSNADGWTTINADGDDHDWYHSSEAGNHSTLAITSHTGAGHMMSESYCNATWAALHPDEYLVTPQMYSIVNGSVFSFWACAQDENYAAEHFGVAISTTGNTNAADFTTINEWTLTAKGNGKFNPAATRDGEGTREGNWYQYTCDLSAYAGQNVYIAIRHFGCSDMFIMCMDDAQLTAGAKGATAFESGMTGNAYAFNITDVANFDERVYVLYNLYNDVRFDIINGEADGMFMISAAAGYEDMDLEETINDFMFQSNNQFRMMDKVQAADVAREYKASLPTSFANSLMMDLYVASRQNNLCETADPFCTDNGMYEFPAGVNAGSGENGPYYDCLYTTPNPAWYYMKMSDPGDMDIYMYSTPDEDIDFCCWGPFADPTSECPNGLTSDKVVSCSYSAAPTEHCMIPATAQTGEYYILVITNYSNSPCNINFSKVAGSGSTDCSIMPDVDIIGFLITLDGEYLDIVGPEVREYTHEGEFGDHIYCVRPIYPGEMNLPDHNYGWSMGCPVCSDEPVPPVACDPGEPIRGEYLWNNANDFGALISWGEQVEPIGEWLYYDDDVLTSAVGTGGAGMYWGIMIPSAQLGAYAGCSLTQVAVMEWESGGTYTVNIYYGGATPSAGTLVHSQDFTTTGITDWKYVTLSSALPIDPSQNLWITFYQANIDYPATCCNNTGDANGRWASVDGADWDDILALAPTLNYTWMIRGYVTNEAKGGEIHALEPFKGKAANAPLSAAEQVNIPTHFAFANRADIVKYNVYRSADNVNYELIGSVNAVAGQTYYEYFDATAAGTYYYQVRAEYSDGCESEPAQSEANPDNNYVIVNVTSVAENGEVALYPNPTNGNITIQAQNMNRITVVSVLGQVVYDAEVEGESQIINMAQFNAGMYMVRIATENGVSTQRVTVVK